MYFCNANLNPIPMHVKFNKTIFAALFISSIIIIGGCVPARKYQDMVERRESCETRNTELRKINEELTTTSTELRSTRDRLLIQTDNLRRDTTEMGQEFRRLKENYNRLARTYEIILERNENLMAGKDTETSRILSRLQETQDDLNRREDELKRAAAIMQDKERNLNELNERLQRFSRELNAKEQRVNELEKIISRQDSMVKTLRQTVSNALLGFEGQGLTVQIKNGKVYVSMEESLLFASGSTNVDTRGVNAIRQLAGVLERNPDINVLIEGHTDDVPVRQGSQFRDNWDLSVMRATSIARIILQNQRVDPRRLTVAGRGEFMPLDPARTPEARRKNRRTEIILTPKLDQLFQIIDLN